MSYTPKLDTRPNLAFGILETRRKRHERGGSPADVLVAMEAARAARAARLGHRQKAVPVLVKESSPKKRSRETAEE